ncbi:bifunctional serine/threonine-protein kinase/ABC transporter substrate-binding protein [Streptomyces sp. B6B3]|uniref:bifunctional serine/threonine-protein kinase/ABC transporter substrate-binding protein n=1 Tax=Streptomyces sp. B6B3 TaxID=3153570 RepID=UPI00325EC2B7
MTEFEALAAGDPRQVGRYRVLARLGAGGMGLVFLARSPGGRPVAVKVVRAELADDPRFRQRFAREIAAARRVNSFFTAGVVDADPEGSPPWLATAYVAGVSLVEAVTAHGPWAERSVRALGAGLVEALEAIHGVGMVHRDLKPSNVLLAPDGPRVIDFGISLAVEDTGLTQTGSVVGTPGFMSPEQLTGAPVGPPSDVFALGAVLAYAATGSGPFGTGSAHGINFRAVYEPPELGGVAPGLRELLWRCLEKDPGRRPAVAELLDRLAEADDATGDAEAGPPAATALGTADWLPAPVADTVGQANNAVLPSTPPPPAATPTAPTTPPATTPTPPTAPPLSTTAPTATAASTTPPPPAGAPSGYLPPGFTPAGPPVPPNTKPRVSRRALLTGAGATAAVATVGGLVWQLTRPDGSEDGDPTGDGGTGGNGWAADGEGEEGVVSRTVRIAVHAPLTGSASAMGSDALEAARLAVDDARESGDHPGLRVEILELDDQGMAELAGETADTAIADPLVLAVVGPVLSAAVQSAAPQYGEAGLAIVTPTATNMSLTQQGYPTFLRATPNDEQVGTDIGQFLALQEVTSVMLVDDLTEYGVTLADAAASVLTSVGVQVMEESLADTPDFNALAQTVISSGAEALAFCGSYPEAGPLAAALSDESWAGIRVSGDGIMNQEFLDLAGPGRDGWYAVCPCSDPSQSSDGRDFADRYETRTGRPPGPHAPRAYDVTMMIIETVAELGEEADRTTVYEELAGARYDGLTGEIRFDANGEYRGSGTELFHVNNATFEPLGPTEDYRD